MAGKSYASAPDEAKFRAESDLMTLVEAERIKRDKARMAAAMKCREEKMVAMQAIGKQEKSKS